MKLRTLPSIAAGLLLVASLGLPVAGLAETTQPSTPVPATPSDEKPSANVSGKVEAKSDTTLTVGGRIVSINSATTFSRNGASIGSADIKVGDKVNVVTSNNGQVAVSVDVIASE